MSITSSAGSTKFLLGQKLEDFTRDELKAHLAARKLPVEGSKAELIERLKVGVCVCTAASGSMRY